MRLFYNVSVSLEWEGLFFEVVFLMSEVLFSDLGLRDDVAKAIDEMGFTAPSEIQGRAIPLLLETDKDFVGLAQTGTGKTAAFVIPLLHKIDTRSTSVQAIILAPSRELAMQVEAEITKLGRYTDVRSACIYGGTSYERQIRSLKSDKPHIVVATPGRALDFLNKGILKLGDAKCCVLDEADETVVLTLSNPSNATLGSASVHTYTINDNDSTPTIDFNTTSSSGAESVASKAITVDLSGPSGEIVTIDYAVTGTATGSGTDYTLINGTLSIAAGTTSGTITIANIINDTADEPDETVIITLSSPSNATLGSNQVHTYTIADDDGLPSVDFGNSSSSGAEDISTVALTVYLSAASSNNITVNYAVTGTATGSGTDYTLADDTLTISAGATSGTITIADIVDDESVEGNETVIITLSGPNNAVLGSDSVHTYTIRDNDGIPAVAFSATTSAELESVVSRSLTIVIPFASEQQV